MDEAYFSVDIETSGPVPGDYSMLSLGACLVDNPSRTFYIELQPTTRNADPEALRITGFDLDLLTENGEEPHRAMRRFSEWIQKTAEARTPIFVGFNAAFDWAFVNWYFHHFLLVNPFGIAPIDVKSFYMGLSGALWKETKSSRLPPEFQPGVAPEGPHNALGDARRQADMFRRMLTEAHSR
jgi:DNA polymerase III epsilon subunit-like protein